MFYSSTWFREPVASSMYKVTKELMKKNKPAEEHKYKNLSTCKFKFSEKVSGYKNQNRSKKGWLIRRACCCQLQSTGLQRQTCPFPPRLEPRTDWSRPCLLTTLWLWLITDPTVCSD